MGRLPRDCDFSNAERFSKFGWGLGVSMGRLKASLFVCKPHCEPNTKAGQPISLPECASGPRPAARRARSCWKTYGPTWPQTWPWTFCRTAWTSSSAARLLLSQCGMKCDVLLAQGWSRARVESMCLPGLGVSKSAPGKQNPK